MYTTADYDDDRDDPYYGLSEGVSCALPALRPIALTLIGAVVVAAALVMWIAQRVRRGKAA